MAERPITDDRGEDDVPRSPQRPGRGAPVAGCARAADAERTGREVPTPGWTPGAGEESTVRDSRRRFSALPGSLRRLSLALLFGGALALEWWLLWPHVMRGSAGGGGLLAAAVIGPPSMTWAQVREALVQLYQHLTVGRNRAREAVLWPEGKHPSVVYSDAFAELYAYTNACQAVAEDLVEGFVRTVLPVRPLELVLAELVAEGHTDIDLQRYVWSEQWRCRTRTAAMEWPGADSGREVVAAWRETVEDGEAQGGTPAAAAEARLAQVREQRAERLAAVRALVEALSR